MRRPRLFNLIVICCAVFLVYFYFSNATQFWNTEDEVEEASSFESRFFKLSTRIRDLENRLKANAINNRNVLSEGFLGKAASPIAVLIIACNRPQALTEHVSSLLKLRTSPSLFPIVISLDCSHEPTRIAAQAFGSDVSIIENPDQSEVTLSGKQKKFSGYYKIARHYRFALSYVFDELTYKYALITEDDLKLAPDFFEYFLATRHLLDEDETIWCISAWNDVGKEGLIERNASMLHRTDFFPGLGWMLTRKLWMELKPKWPIAFWDDWMREPSQRQDRACVRPEISRTGMSPKGKKGVSKGLFYEKHLKHIILNDEFFPFTTVDLSYLTKEKYDEEFNRDVYSWPSITQTELIEGKLVSGEPLPPKVRLTYESRWTFKETAKKFKLMDDFRSGVCRTCYRGVLSFMFGKYRVFLAPPPSWTSYNTSWT